MQITFAQPGQFALAQALLRQAAARTDAADPATGTIQVSDSSLAALLERIASGTATILPIWGGACDRWLLAAASRHQAERAFLHAKAFVLPSYGSLPADEQFAIFRSFAATDAPLPAAIEAGYTGYFEWRTPPEQRSTVLRRLHLWAQLEASTPPLAEEQAPSYASLFARFQSALAAANWLDAEQSLADMRRLHLSTFDNLQFLRVELLARRGEWRAIWSDPVFPVLASSSAPRTVRSALLSAFHHSVLLSAEQAGDFDAVLSHLRAAQPQLGKLLTGRFGLTGAAVIRVFAYQAAATHDRESLADLLAVTPLDDGTRLILEQLRAALPAPVSAQPPPSLAERLRHAMQVRDYDRAIQVATQLIDPIEHTLALLRIAMRHPDAAQGALDAYEQLAPNERSLLEEEEPLVDFYLERILEIARPQRPEIRTWPDWFDRFAADANDAALEPAVDTLRQAADDRSWSPGTLHATREKLEALLLETSLLSVRKVKRTLTAIADQLLKDQEFPRTETVYTDLYDALLDCLVLMHEVNENEGRKLLRLMEARLRVRPTAVEGIANDLRDWLQYPSLALEGVALDGFELLIQYGCGRPTPAAIYRLWLESLLDLPAAAWGRSNQEVWYAIGEWLQAGEDLLHRLGQRLTTAATMATRDPLANLPDGCRIGVFSLSPTAAWRAGAIIQRRNPNVQFDVCDATVLTGAAEHLAQWADVPVVVATCLTHAVFYGIEHLLQRAPVYPASQGSSSILRAVENFALQLH